VPRRPRESMRLPLLAGWLFADLMLLLFVIGLSFAPAQTVTVSSKPTASPTAHPSPSPSPSPQPTQRVLNRTYYTIYVNVSLSDLQGDINSAIAEATTAGNILRTRDPEFGQASFLPEWTGNPTPTFVELILFFYAS